MTDKYPKPSVTVDTIIFALEKDQLQILLIQRKGEPFKGKWAIPGGFVDIDEPLETAAYRELQEETGLTSVQLAQFRSFGDPGRDPRGRTITVSYITFLPEISEEIKGTDDADDARWFSIKALPELAFDHNKVLQEAIEDLRLRLDTASRAASYFDGNLKIADIRAILSGMDKI
jgi:8-oxo-dGTP diphosphatase